MDITELVPVLREREKHVDPDFDERLNDRKKDEREFHNATRKKEKTDEGYEDIHDKLFYNRNFYSTVQLSREHLQNWMQTKIPGKVFLDFACGDGEKVIEAAKLGAAIAVGIDISDVRVQNGRNSAKLAGVEERCIFLQADCEQTQFPENSFDAILCSGMLHHLDLSYALPELRRILKPGGSVFALEALDYNPVISLYRQMTPGSRTAWEKEHILSLKDIDFAKRFFDIRDLKFWHLFSILGTFFRNRPAFFKVLMPILNGIDKILLSIPGLRLLSWQFSFQLVKRHD